MTACAFARRAGAALCSGVLGVLVLTLPASGEWVEFIDETASRLEADPEFTTEDFEEKAFAHGDVDQDGDIDLICVRKEPFTSAGRRVNVLFMNEGTAEGWTTNGILVDRTADYAAASDVSGDDGFLTATNDRDVILADFDGDGWLDMVTAVTNAATFDSPAKYISHPRIYMNLGEDVDGEWLGFEFQNDRFPQIYVDGDPEDPCFCSVAAGDVDADGDLDLYIGEYDSSCTPLVDVDDRLFLNDGDGYFTDATEDSFVGSVAIAGGIPFHQSAFGTSVAILDLNDDGIIDILKDTALNVPQYIGTAYGSPGSVGVFDEDDIGYQVIDTTAPYFVSAGDLNDDGLLDLVVTDDGSDHFWLNQGNAANDQVIWESHNFSFTGGGFDDGFGGNSVIVDLDRDGYNDVVIADVDIDIDGCGRRMHIYRNLGDTPDVTLQEQGGAQTWTPNGVHDVAIFDIDQDGWLDMVIGTCTGTEVWMHDPPQGLRFTYPDGLPTLVEPDLEFVFQFRVEGIDLETAEPGTGRLFTATSGGTFTEGTIVEIEENLYEATLPAVACAERVQFYVAADTASGLTYSDPADAPFPAYAALAATGSETLISEEFDREPTGWDAGFLSGTTGGFWEWTDAPVGTFDSLVDVQLAPDDDAEQSVGGGLFVTDNGSAGASISANDVDGTAILTSDTYDFEGTDGTVSFAWWFASTRGTPDEFAVEVSNDDGLSWAPVTSTEGTNGWATHAFLVSGYVTPTDAVRVRFIAADSPNDSLTEAGIDNFTVARLTCDDTPSGPTFVRGDANGDGAQDISDPITLLDSLYLSGAPIGCEDAADANDDGVADVADAVRMLGTLFESAAPLPDPHPDCGGDATSDALGCADYAACP